MRRQQTEAEGWLWYELKAKHLNGYKFSRQVPLGPYIADFVCRREKLVIEIDGSQHGSAPNDTPRTAWLNANGYSVLRFWNNEILKERQRVLETIVSALEGRLSGAGKEAGWWPTTPSPHRGEVPERSEGGEGETR